MSARTWEQSARGWWSRDSDLDPDVDALPLKVRAGIRDGRNFSFAQAEAIKEAERKARESA